MDAARAHADAVRAKGGGGTFAKGKGGGGDHRGYDLYPRYGGKSGGERWAESGGKGECMHALRQHSDF